MKPKFNSRFFLGFSSIVLALTASSAVYGATETFNTAGTTFNWVCPSGVTSIQVECWGGGGAGGAGRKDANTGTSSQQNGGGGGGGAYAKKVAVPVTAGATYSVTIPAVAVSGSAGTTTNAAGRVNGSNVTFVGNSSVTVTAAGGTGGANAYVTGSNTVVTAAGGAGGVTGAPSVGDVGALFAGGAGATSSSTTSGASGSGGGGGGSTAAGGAGTATTASVSSAAPVALAGGNGGSIGGGTGGSGFGAGSVSTNFSAGGPGAVAGGGGGGGHNVGQNTRLGGNGGAGQIAITYTDPAANVKADNGTSLNLAGSWTAYLPNVRNIAEWDSTVTSANTTVLGADLALSGIKISNPAGPVTINAGNTLTLGSATQNIPAAIDIDMSAATQDLTVIAPVLLADTRSANVWDVNTGRTLTLGGAVSGTSVAVTKQGLGTATLLGLSATPANNYTGTTTLSGGTLALTTTSPSLTGGLTFGTTPSTLDLSGVASSATFAGAMSATTNSASSNTIVISSGKTLTLNGNVTVGANVANAVASLVTSGGGNLVVGTGGANTFQVGGTTGATLAGSSAVDLSSLASFTLNYDASGTLRLGDSNTGSNTPAPSTLKLATDNTITVGNFRIGDTSGGNATHVLTLGSGANIINSTTTNIGSAGSGIRSGGSVVFGGADTTGALTLRGFGGAGTRTILNMVNTTGNTSVGMSSTLNLAGHTANVAVSTLTLGTRAAGGGATSTLTFDQGTLDVTTLNMANRSGSATTVTATVNLGDSVAVGVPTVTIGGITMAVSASAGNAAANLNISGGNVGINSINMANAGAAATATSNIVLTGGTTTLAGDITRTGGAGTENATITLNGGILDLAANDIGTLAGPITFAARSGTLQNLAELNGGGALTKTTTGTLVLTGTNTYTGGTNVDAGILLLSGAFNMPATGTLQVNGGGNFSLADGTASATTTTAALGLVNGATLTFDWNAANLDTLTSTAAATTAGAVAISINPTSPTGSGGTLVSSPLGGLSGAGYFLLNSIDFTAPLLVTDTSVSIGTITTGLTPLANAYWLGGQLTGGGLGAMALSTGAVSNWATDAAGTSAGGLVPGGSAANVIFGASAATEQANVTTGGNLNLGSITFNDSAAVTISGTHTITLNSTSATAATSSGSGTTVTPGSAISVTSSANAANAINANLTLAANQTWNVASGSTLSIGGALGGSGSLTKADAGSLTLAGANSHTGGTSISAGSLNLNGPLSGGGAVSTSGTGVLTQGSTATISGAASFTQGSAALTSTLAAANTYTGNTTVSAGILEISGTGKIYNAAANTATVTVATGAQITLSGVATNNALGFGASANWVVSGTINSSGGSAQTLPANVTLNNGTLTGITSIAPNEQFGTFYSGSGGCTLTANGATNTLSAGNVGMSSSGTLTLATPLVGDALAVSSALGVNVGGTQVAGALSKTGLGSVTLSGTNIYLGATTVSAGTLTVAAAGSITTTGNILLNVSGASSVAKIEGAYTSTGGGGVAVNSGGILNTSGTVEISGANNQAIFMGTVAGSGTWNVTGGSVMVNYTSNGWGIGNTGTGTLNVSAGSVTTAATNVFNVGHGAGGTGILTVSGGGLVTVNAGTGAFNIGANATSTGIVNLDGGTLALGRRITKNASSTATFNFNGGLLQAGLSSATYMTGLTNANVRNGGAKIDSNTFNVTIGQPLIHSIIGGDNATDGGLTKSGTGTLTLAGANTYTGPTSISGGTLQLDSSAAVGPFTTSGTSVGSSGTLGFTTGTASILNLAASPLTLGGTLAFDIGSTGVNDSVTVDNFSLTGNSFVAINPIGAFTSGGSYTVLTSASPIVTGGFSLSGTTAGRLSVTPTVNTNTVTITPTLDESAWNFNGSENWDTGANWTSYKPTLAGDAALFGSVITGPATVTVNALQTVGYIRFNNANPYTIGTNGSSNLTLDNLAAPALVVVNSGSHTIAENVALTSNLLVAPVTGTTLTVSGNLSGTGKTLGMVEAGTLVLSGTANSYTGATTVSAGTMDLTGSLTGGGAITVSGNGVLNESSIGVISGASSITHSSSGTSTLAGANTSTGAINVTNGQLNISNRGAGNMGAVLVSTGGILEFSGSATYSTTQMSVGATSATTGTVNQTGGTVSFPSGNALLVGTGIGVGSTGIYNLSGGSLTSYSSATRGVMLGANDGDSATFNLSGTGDLSLANAILMIGRSDVAQTGCTALFNQTGGTATVNVLTIGGTGAGTATGTMSLSAGTFVANTFTKLALATNDVAVINISGTADVTLPDFPTVRGVGATATINFDGGTLKPKAASATYMGGLTDAFIKAGGAKFDTTGFDITVTQDLLTDVVSTGGGLTKAGTNTLTLAGTNTYTGGTTISGGILSVANSSALGSGTVAINGGSRLAINTGLSVSNAIAIGTNTGISGRGLVEAGTTAGTAILSGPITITSGAAAGGHFAALTAGTILELQGAITSSATVSLRAGTIILSGGGTGYTDISATGIVRVGATNGVATTASVALGTAGASGTLDLNGFNQTLAGITKGGSPATIGNSSTTTDSTLTTTGTSSYDGTIVDVISPGTRKVALTVASGDLTLTGDSSFTGNIAVNGGKLSATAGPVANNSISGFGASSNTRTITVASGATLEFATGNVFGGHNTLNVPDIIVNGGTITNKELVIVDPLLIKVNNALRNVTLNSGTITATEGNQNSNIDVVLRPGEGYGAWGLNGTVTSTGTSTIDTGLVTGKGGRILLSSNTADTIFDVTSGTLTVSAPLQTGESTPNYGLTKNGAGTLLLTAANIYTTDTTVNAGTLQLADNAQLKFVLGAATGANNDITGAGTVTLDGDFVIDTTAADALATGSWTLENVTSLTGAYGSTFTVVGFTDAGSNKWTKVNGAKVYTFDETTGILTLAASAGYSSWAAINAPTTGSNPKADEDGDGVSNGAEYVLGGTIGTQDLGRMPKLSTTGGNLIFTFERIKASIDGSTNLAIEVGTNLVSWTAPNSPYAVSDTATGPVNPGVTVATSLVDPLYDTVTLTVPQSPDAAKFARLKVVVTP